MLQDSHLHCSVAKSNNCNQSASDIFCRIGCECPGIEFYIQEKESLLSPITAFNSRMLMQQPFKVRHKSGFKINDVFVQFNFSFQPGIIKLKIYARPHLVEVNNSP